MAGFPLRYSIHVLSKAILYRRIKRFPLQTRCCCISGHRDELSSDGGIVSWRSAGHGTASVHCGDGFVDLAQKLDRQREYPQIAQSTWRCVAWLQSAACTRKWSAVGSRGSSGPAAAQRMTNGVTTSVWKHRQTKPTNGLVAEVRPSLALRQHFTG